MIPQRITAGIKNQMTEININGETGHLVTVYKIIAKLAGIYKPSMFFNSLRNSIVTFDKNKLAPDDGKVINTLLSSAKYKDLVKLNVDEHKLRNMTTDRNIVMKGNV